MQQEEPTAIAPRKPDEILDEGGMTVSYEVSGYASIHFHPKPELLRKEKLRVFERGLAKLAEGLRDKRKEGKRIPSFVAATSWLVAENEPFFTRRDFTIVSDYGTSDMKALVAEYRRRKIMTKMVPVKKLMVVPKIALLKTKTLLGED